MTLRSQPRPRSCRFGILTEYHQPAALSALPRSAVTGRRRSTEVPLAGAQWAAQSTYRLAGIGIEVPRRGPSWPGRFGLGRCLVRGVCGRGIRGATLEMVEGGELVHRILIVEDESHLAEGLRFNLEAEGYVVEIAEDGPAGERALNEASEPFGLVILDVMLPGMSGFELAQRIRAAGNFVPILILTAKDAAQDLIRGIEDGADDYLTKPFHLDELLARVRGLLRRRRWDGVDAQGDSMRSFRSARPRFTSTVSNSRHRTGWSS